MEKGGGIRGELGKRGKGKEKGRKGGKYVKGEV